MNPNTRAAIDEVIRICDSFSNSEDISETDAILLWRESVNNLRLAIASEN